MDRKPGKIIKDLILAIQFDDYSYAASEEIHRAEFEVNRLFASVTRSTTDSNESPDVVGA